MAILKRTILLFVLLIVGIGLGWSIKIKIGTKREIAKAPELIAAYKSAQLVPTIPQDKTVRPEPPKWKHALNIPGLPPILIEAYGFVGGKVVATYNDGTRYLVANPGDYVYPTEIRVDSATNKLYVFADGLAAGIWRASRIYEFDLVARRQTNKAEINPDMLKNDAKGSTSP